MPLATCPHCKHNFDATGSILEAINIECNAGSLDNPERVIDGVRFFFRGYQGSAQSIELIGACIAYHPLEKGTPKSYYVCLTGGAPEIVARGQAMNMNLTDRVTDIDLITDNRARFKAFRDKAMNDLIRFVCEKENLSCPEL